MKKYFLLFDLFLSYLANWLAKIFKPDPDLRYLFSYNKETKCMENLVGETMFVLPVGMEYEGYVCYEGKKIKLLNCLVGQEKMFYGLPIICNQDCRIVFSGYCDDFSFEFKKGEFIDYKLILSEIIN